MGTLPDMKPSVKAPSSRQAADPDTARRAKQRKNSASPVRSLGLIACLSLLLSLESGAVVDIQMDWVAVPNGSWYCGDEVWMGYGLRNRGTDPCPGFSVRFYASTDTTISAADHDLGTLPGGVLAEGQSFSNAGFITLPLDLPAGIYYIGAVATAVGDGATGNNSAYDTTPIETRLHSNLGVVTLGAPVYRMYRGATFPVNISIRNFGPGDCSGFSVRFVASRSIIILDTDPLLGERSFGPLEAGETVGGSSPIDLTWPPDIPTDVSYYVGAIIEYAHDPLSANNTERTEFQIFVESRPDLAVISCNAEDGEYLPGDSLGLTATVRNEGDEDCTDYTAAFYASEDDTITPGDYPIGSFLRGSLAQGATDMLSVTGTLPPDIPPGTYTVGIIVTCLIDGVSANDKGSDANPIEVGLSDLRGEELLASPIPHNPLAGLYVRYTVANDGPAGCPGYALDFYLSSDNQVTGADQLVHHVDATPLNAGNQHINQITVLLPGGTAPGVYYLGMIPTYEHDPVPGNNLIVSAPLLLGVDPPNIVAVRRVHPVIFQIDWTAPEGHTYALTRSRTLTDGFPTVLASGMSPTATGLTTTDVPMSGGDRFFYRIELEP